MNETLIKNKISLEEAKLLLFETNNEISNLSEKLDDKSNYIDKYGNYIYSTDLILDKNNAAYSSSDGYDYISRYMIKDLWVQ